jgi:hypothetical protein
MIDNSYADVGGSYDFGGFDDAGASSFGAGNSPAPVSSSFSASETSGFPAPFDNSFVGPPAPAGLPAYSADEMAGDFAREQNRFSALPSFGESPIAATSASTTTPTSTTTSTPYTGGTDWAADVAARRSSLDWWTTPATAAPPVMDTTPRSIEVQPGDSLSRIAGRLAGDGASAGLVNDLKNGFIAANPQLSNPNQLQVGQWLNLPRADTVFDNAAFARATAADTQYLASRQPALAPNPGGAFGGFGGFGASSTGSFGAGLSFGGPSFADLSAPAGSLGGFGGFANAGSAGSPPAAAAPPDALAQSRADMKAFYAQAQDNAVRDGNPFKYVGAHIASLAGDVGYDAAEGARGLFRLATDGNAREAAWNGLSNAVTQAVTHPGDTWDAGVRSVNHFLELPFQEQADTVFKGGLGLLAGAGSAKLTTAVGSFASQGLRSAAQWAIPTLDRLDTLADAGAMATRRLPPSGNATFDTLFADSPQASAMTAGLERRGVKLVDDVTALDPGEAAHVRLIDNQPHLFYDSGSTSLLDMLHESRHVAQIQRVQAADVLGDKSLFSTRLVGAAERGAYEYELRLGERFGFSDTYKNALREQVDKYYPSSLSIKFNSSDRMRAIFEAMEPGLKP